MEVVVLSYCGAPPESKVCPRLDQKFTPNPSNFHIHLLTSKQSSNYFPLYCSYFMGWWWIHRWSFPIVLARLISWASTTSLPNTSGGSSRRVVGYHHRSICCWLFVVKSNSYKPLPIFVTLNANKDKSQSYYKIRWCINAYAAENVYWNIVCVC